MTKARAGNGAGGSAVGGAVFETLFERALEPTLITRLDGTLVRVNEAAAFLLGWRPEDLVGKPRDQIVVVDDALRRALAERERTGSARADVTCRRADGSTFLAEITSAVVDGPERLAYVMIRDLTTEREAARALVESEQRFAAVFDRAPLAMALSKIPETTYVAANDAWRKLFEVGNVDVVGKTGVELGIAAPGDWARTTEQLLREGSLRGREVVRLTKAGQARTLLLSMEPLSIGGERHVISIALDVTAQRAAEAALRGRPGGVQG